MQLSLGYTARTGCNWNVHVPRSKECNWVNIVVYFCVHVFSRVRQDLLVLLEQRDLQ